MSGKSTLYSLKIPTMAIRDVLKLFISSPYKYYVVMALLYLPIGYMVSLSNVKYSLNLELSLSHMK